MLKLLMIIVEPSKKEKLEIVLAKNEVVGYTEIPRVHGTGESGQRMASSLFPKSSTLVFTVVAADRLDDLIAGIEAYIDDYEESLKMMVLNVEKMI